MKRKISDLLDGYPADVDLNSPTPLSPSRIEELTMNIITNQSKHKRRVPLRALAVAAIAAILCGSALAVGQTLGAGDWFRSFFTPEDGTLTDTQLGLMDEMGQAFEGPDGATPAAVTCNGATITPLAALADENVYYLRLRVEAPEGTVLPDLDGETEGYYQLSSLEQENRITLDCTEGAYETSGWSLQLFWQPDDDPADNAKEVVLRFVRQDSTDLCFNDGVSKRLTIQGLWVQNSVKKYTPVFTGEFAFDIGLSYESRTVSPDCAGLTYENSVLGGYTNTLTSLSLSPLSMTCSFSTTLLENDTLSPAPGPFEIVMKDGSVFYSDRAEWVDFEVYFGDPEVRWGSLPYPDKESTFIFDELLDLDQVDYIRYGENRIDLGK